MQLPSKEELQEFEKWGVPPPTHESHGVKDEEIEGTLVPTKASKWWMEGNVLVAITNHGELRQTIPTDYICKGMDKKGLPILEKLDI